MRLLISAGEASGDLYGAALLKEMQRLGLPPDAAVEAVGGKRLKDAGARLIADSSRWGAIGTVQALRVAPRVILGARSARRALLGDPGLFVPIDFGYINVKLCRVAKRLGWKVLYFLPPGSWRKDRQGGDLPKITDGISTPFGWSQRLLTAAGANARWYGHPIKQLARESAVPPPTERTNLAVLPGSRRHEIQLNLPLIAEALKSRTETFEFAVATTVDRDRLKVLWTRLSGRMNDVFTESDLQGVLARARAAVVCSGTATLEAALAGCPMVVVYKTTRIMHLEAYLIGLKRPFSLPNILLGRNAVPELADSRIDPADLAETMDRLMSDARVRDAQFQAFRELDSLLGSDDAITKTAEWALEFMRC